MRRVLLSFGAIAVLLLASLSPAARALCAPPLASELVKAALSGESTTVAAGQTLWVDVRLTVAPGWHVYWQNPGDSGLPTEIGWVLPRRLRGRRDRLAGARAVPALADRQ